MQPQPTPRDRNSHLFIARVMARDSATEGRAASGKTAILAPNPDGSYTVIGVYC